MKTLDFLAILAVLLLAPHGAHAIQTDPFGPSGQGGSRNGQTFTIGQLGSVYEFDAFLHIHGEDLNGDLPGTAVPLSRNVLPADLAYQFDWELALDFTALLCTYTFQNTGTEVFEGLRLLVLLDAEINEEINGFDNEYAEVIGTPGHSSADAAPDFWQAGEPGFQGGSLLRNLLEGRLPNTNEVTQANPNDVAMALGFLLGDLQPNRAISARVLISKDGTRLGDFALVQRDLADTEFAITFSGEADINDPGIPPTQPVTSLVQMGFTWRLDRPTGALIGTLSLSLPSTVTASIAPPFQLVLRSSDTVRYVQSDGSVAEGLYVDLTDSIAAQIGVVAPLQPGQSVIVDGIRVYSANRTAPPTALFELWAQPIP